jgi:hypothetical protein
MSLTSITIPGAKTPGNAMSSAISHSFSPIPYPLAFNRAKAFIKIILRNELELLDHDASEKPLFFSLVKKAGGSRSIVVDRCRHQLEAYAQNQWPFNIGGISDEVDTLTWWENLLHNNSSDVLAVCVQTFALRTELTWAGSRQLLSRFSQHS